VKLEIFDPRYGGRFRKFYDKGNQVREHEVRKGMAKDLKNIAQDIRLRKFQGQEKRRFNFEI